MEIIDFSKKGNVIRFYLGEKTEDWGWVNKDFKDYRGETPDWLKPCDTFYGDDWNDMPYEHNAGTVYEEFIKKFVDVAINYDDLVLEPCEGTFNSSWCKDDMVARKVPCLIIVPKELRKGHEWNTDFRTWIGVDGITKIYFGDNVEEIIKKLNSHTLQFGVIRDYDKYTN